MVARRAQKFDREFNLNHSPRLICYVCVCDQREGGEKNNPAKPWNAPRILQGCNKAGLIWIILDFLSPVDFLRRIHCTHILNKIYWMKSNFQSCCTTLELNRHHFSYRFFEYCHLMRILVSRIGSDQRCSQKRADSAQGSKRGFTVSVNAWAEFSTEKITKASNKTGKWQQIRSNSQAKHVSHVINSI